MILKTLNFVSNTDDCIYRSLTIKDGCDIRSMVFVQSKGTLLSYESSGTPDLYFMVTNFLRASRSI